MSAQACLAGLFPPAPEQIWKENFDFNPIPVHTQPQQEDYILATVRKCDRFEHFFGEYIKTGEYNEIFEKYRSIIQYLEKNIEKKFHAVADIYDLYDTLNIQKSKGKQCVG